MLQPKDADGQPNTALNRLYTIIMTESMYLIWLQCEWMLDHGSEREKIIPKSDSQVQQDGNIRQARLKFTQWPQRESTKTGVRDLERYFGTRGRPPQRLCRNVRGFSGYGC